MNEIVIPVHVPSKKNLFYLIRPVMKFKKNSACFDEVITIIYTFAAILSGKI
jgi:hypothetical protein